MDYGYRLTTHGLELMAACMAQKAPLTLTRVAMGSGKVAEGTNLADVHELVNYVVDGSIGERHHSENRLYITVQYENQAHPDTPMFIMGEFIVYAQHPVTGEDTDLLYATLGDYSQPIPPYVESQPPSVWKYPLALVLSNELQVTVDAPAGTVTHDDLEEAVKKAVDVHNEDPGAHQAIMREVSEAKRAAENAHTIAGEATDAAEAAMEAAKENAKAIQQVASQQGQLVSGMVRMAVIDFTIPQEAWIKDEGAIGRWLYYADVTDERISVSHLPDVTLDMNSMEIAYACGMCPGVEISEDTKIRFFAQEAPDAAITGECALWTEGGGSGGSGGGVIYELPIASQNQLGAVRIGEGIDVTEDGTISSDAKVPADQIATPDDTSDMLEEIFKET